MNEGGIVGMATVEYKYYTDFNNLDVVIIVEYSGNPTYKYLNGRLHCENGPAVIFPNEKCWYLHGERHNEHGPAVVKKGYQCWYLIGYPRGISVSSEGIRIGCKTKPTIADWDEWFAGTEEFLVKRDSKEFKVLLALWDQFKRQIGDY